MLLKSEFGLEKFKLQPHRPQLVFEQEVRVLESQPVTGGLAVRGIDRSAGNAGILVG
jgi:hypothetical protein